MWKLILTQLKMRASRMMCICPTVVGIIGFAVYVIFAGNGSPSTQLKFAPLVFLAGILFALAGYFWFKEPLDYTKRTCCSYCDYDLQGHGNVPDLCPECGSTPTPLSISTMLRTASRLVLIPGVLLIFMSIGCMLLTLLYLFLMVQGGPA